MIAPLAQVVDLDALWKIVLIALGGGVGVTAIFGFGVLRGEALEQARTEGRSTAVLVNGALVALCGAVCLAAIVFGVIAMTHK
ncbi:hypothetical protein [Patulibacter minatonensis]|uniref:hypothetical protein n=1 Tax=Patulibacter minatonensis TaxID=298163 RepID=UPI00047CDFE5|nr:hypothetical protein [Patulibacter minatonensis]